MTTNFNQFVPSDFSGEVFDDTLQFVKEHLSSVVDEFEDALRFVNEVNIDFKEYVRESDGTHGTLICGTIDRDPCANYLRDDFDPEDDCLGNPLSVPSILDNRDGGDFE